MVLVIDNSSRFNAYTVTTWLNGIGCRHLGMVVKNLGKSMVQILDIYDLNAHSRLVDQIQFQEPVGSVPISFINSNTSDMNCFKEDGGNTNEVALCISSEPTTTRHTPNFFVV
ncbi:unnamed protein product [Schistosoma curassoni]|uniref:Integrase catalytic domain-containing protein n=1 Tax=Schistosoma curassoni TaxID=6186 RepID=A0A183JDP4_9TREM|nr:unnamed protein product [Schistosoma curassoni]